MPVVEQPPAPTTVFYSYAAENERHRQQLDKHLAILRR
jgi:hypothetical protein